MDLASQFKELAEELALFRTEMASLEQATDDPHLRELLKQIGQDWQQQTAQLKEAFPQAMSELDQQRAEIEQTLETARTTAAQAEAELAKGIDEDGAIEMPTPEVAAPDGAALRDELLDQFGIPAHTAPASRGVLGSVADLASGSFASTDAAPAPAKPAPPAPPSPHPQAKPPSTPKKGKDDAWEMTSDDWSRDE